MKKEKSKFNNMKSSIKKNKNNFMLKLEENN